MDADQPTLADESAYRVVALDLDGTTVRGDGTISERTTAALRRIESLGVIVMAVTGRPPRWMPPLLDSLGRRGLAICANGAVVIDLATGEVVEEHLLDVEIVRRLIDDLTAAMPELAFAVEQSGDGGFVFEPSYHPKWTTETAPVSGVDDLMSMPARKLLARHATLSADELLARARGVIAASRAELTHSSREGLLEISAAGVSKATALAAVCEQRGIEADRVVAFGDMPNDIPMLRWAGLGVAVANAHPDLLAVADDVTASNDDDGVAEFLDRLWPPS